ncbi:MAG: hypothetical protein ACOX6K_03080 [Sphaerochaetaceae bacterium]|jgi:HD superfamily phosphohydrolase YqeK
MYRADIYTGLESYVASQVNGHRYAHCRSCAVTMKALLDRFPKSYRDDPAGSDAGMYVGLWHDVARGWSDRALLEFCLDRSLPMEPEERNCPMLLHGTVAAALMPEHIPDCPETWMRAVRWHTLGDISMGALGLAMYITDYLEPLRTHIDPARRRYLLSLSTMEEMGLRIIEDQNEYFRRTGLVQAEATRRLYLHLLRGGRL